MKAYIRSVIFPLVLVMSSLSLISAIVSGLDITLAGLPEIIHEVYRKYAGLFFYWTVEWWLRLKIPPLIQDILAFWAFSSGVLYRYYKRVGTLEEYGRLYLFGPLVFGLVAYQLVDKEMRSAIQPQHMLFYLLHFVFLAFDAVIVVGFFLWNYLAIQALPPVPT